MRYAYRYVFQKKFSIHMVDEVCIHIQGSSENPCAAPRFQGVTKVWVLPPKNHMVQNRSLIYPPNTHGPHISGCCPKKSHVQKKSPNYFLRCIMRKPKNYVSLKIFPCQGVPWRSSEEVIFAKSVGAKRRPARKRCFLGGPPGDTLAGENLQADIIFGLPHNTSEKIIRTFFLHM